MRTVITKHGPRVHVYFWPLPVEATFLHKGKSYRKIAEEKVEEIVSRHVWYFSGHYGCLITMEQFQRYRLREEHCRPLDDHFDMRQGNSK